ncbi:hypothetical protein ABEB36_002136 [Hypothenemus hampei]|uniref:Uncharacterized protein n=1 Tax=Hypothenemus hampei TaxID=57062 RepID=A0ABD1F7T2_HYPHA
MVYHLKFKHILVFVLASVLFCEGKSLLDDSPVDIEVATTPCPDELEKQDNTEQSWTDLEDALLNEGTRKTLNDQESLLYESTTLATLNHSVELEKLETEDSNGSTTLCPEELARQQGMLSNSNADGEIRFNNNESSEDEITTISSKNAEISVKTLLDVQKDSALLKLVLNKKQFSNSPDLDGRTKRQASSNYSPYYSSYDPQSQSSNTYTNEASSSASLLENYNNYRSQQFNNNNNNRKKIPSTNGNVTGYQQMQRQRQNNNYRKNYGQKPVNGYRNPSLNMRYSSNGSVYKVKPKTNRRQYQAKLSSSSTVRPARANLKKKFRPLPVFP